MLDSVIRASAPGSIMLMGEHAVLFGERALACAVDKHIHVTLTPRDDRVINIDSALAQYSASLDELQPDTRLSFVLAAVEQHQDGLHKGFDLKIEAGFGHTLDWDHRQRSPLPQPLCWMLIASKPPTAMSCSVKRWLPCIKYRGVAPVLTLLPVSLVHQWAIRLIPVRSNL